jgi:hypothetical protein
MTTTTLYQSNVALFNSSSRSGFDAEHPQGTMVIDALNQRSYDLQVVLGQYKDIAKMLPRRTVLANHKFIFLAYDDLFTANLMVVPINKCFCPFSKYGTYELNI